MNFSVNKTLVIIEKILNMNLSLKLEISKTENKYEENIQDKLSKIRILNPSYLHQFVGEFKLLVQQKSS